VNAEVHEAIGARANPPMGTKEQEKETMNNVPSKNEVILLNVRTLLWGIRRKGLEGFEVQAFGIQKSRWISDMLYKRHPT
jgi:hypothetical protein